MLEPAFFIVELKGCFSSWDAVIIGKLFLYLWERAFPPLVWVLELVVFFFTASLLFLEVGLGVIVNTTSLSEQVYSYLRSEMASGEK